MIVLKWLALLLVLLLGKLLTVVCAPVAALLSMRGDALPGRWSDSKRLYCFERCALAMGLPVAGRITPELLLAAYAMKGAHDATTD